MNNNQEFNILMLFQILSWILKKNHSVSFNEILADVKNHLQEEFNHYMNMSDSFDVEKRIKQQNARSEIIKMIDNYLKPINKN